MEKRKREKRKEERKKKKEISLIEIFFFFKFQAKSFCLIEAQSSPEQNVLLCVLARCENRRRPHPAREL